MKRGMATGHFCMNLNDKGMELKTCMSVFSGTCRSPPSVQVGAVFQYKWFWGSYEISKSNGKSVSPWDIEKCLRMNDASLELLMEMIGLRWEEIDT